MKQISVQTFKEIIKTEGANPTVDFINVCTPAEFQEKHIDGVRSVPLDELANRVAEFAGKKTIYVHCRSGKRGAQAVERLAALGVEAELVNVEGGLLAWEEQNYPTNSSTKRLPIMRQVLIAAGSLILLAHLLFIFYGPEFLWLSAFVGAGLLFAGVSGWCGMTFLLAKMPWNK